MPVGAPHHENLVKCLILSTTCKRRPPLRKGFFAMPHVSGNYARNLIRKLAVRPWLVNRLMFPHRLQDSLYTHLFGDLHDGYKNDERIVRRP